MDFEVILATETNRQLLNALLTRYLQKVNTLVLVSGQWNRCVAANIGIKAARGEFIAVLEDEITLEDEWLEKLVFSLKSLPKKVGCIASARVQMVHEAFHYEHSTLGIIARAVNELSIANFLRRKRKSLRAYISEGLTFGGDNVLFKREVLIQVGGYTEDIREPVFGDELDLAFKIVESGYTCAINQNCTAAHFGCFVSDQLSKKEDYFAHCCFNDIYVCTKHLGLLKLGVFYHMVYRFVWALGWAYRTKNFRVILYCSKSISQGFISGLTKTDTLARLLNIPTI
jgi:GT2 family glycosyltransferase